MCLPETHTTAPRRSAFGWLRWLACILRHSELEGMDDRLRRDIGLPSRHDRPDAATLLDRSMPGGRRW